MDDNKSYSPYHGCWVIFLLLIGVPVVFYAVVYAAVYAYEPHFSRLNQVSAQCIGCGLGTVFHLSCIIAGTLRDPFRALCSRVKEFFANLPCGLPFALQCYREDLRQDGALFVPYAIIIGVCMYLTIDGVVAAFALL